MAESKSQLDQENFDGLQDRIDHRAKHIEEIIDLPDSAARFPDVRVKSDGRSAELLVRGSDDVNELNATLAEDVRGVLSVARGETVVCSNSQGSELYICPRILAAIERRVQQQLETADKTKKRSISVSFRPGERGLLTPNGRSYVEQTIANLVRRYAEGKVLLRGIRGAYNPNLSEPANDLDISSLNSVDLVDQVRRTLNRSRYPLSTELDLLKTVFGRDGEVVLKEISLSDLIAPLEQARTDIAFSTEQDKTIVLVFPGMVCIPIFFSTEGQIHRESGYGRKYKDAPASSDILLGSGVFNNQVEYYLSGQKIVGRYGDKTREFPVSKMRILSVADEDSGLAEALDDVDEDW